MEVSVGQEKSIRTKWSMGNAMIKESYLASCWIEGKPNQDGLYLFRLDAFKNANDPWYYFYDCRMDTFLGDRSRGKPMLFNNQGGNYPHDYHVSIKGHVTHYCKANGANFQLILDSMKEMHFDSGDMKWNPV